MKPINPAISAMCDCPPALACPNLRKIMNSTPVPAATISVPAMRTMTSAR